MSGIGSTSLGSLFGWVPDTSEEYRRLRVAEARRRRPELSREQLEHRGRYIVDTSSGELFERVPGATLHGHGWMPDAVDTSAAFYVDGTGDPVFLAKPTTPPFTVEQLEAAEQARERANLREAERRREFLDRQPRRPLTLADLDEHMPLTLRQAHEVLLGLGCALEPAPFGFVVHAPLRFAEDAGTDMEARQRVRQAALVLDRAREVVRMRLTAERPLPNCSPVVGGGPP